jgi:hypothetical protein
MFLCVKKNMLNRLDIIFIFVTENPNSIKETQLGT